MIGCGENIGKLYLCVHWEGARGKGGGAKLTKLPFQQWAPPSSSASVCMKFSSLGWGAQPCPHSLFLFPFTEQWQNNLISNVTLQRHYLFLCFRQWQLSSTCLFAHCFLSFHSILALEWANEQSPVTEPKSSIYRHSRLITHKRCGEDRIVRSCRERQQRLHVSLIMLMFGRVHLELGLEKYVVAGSRKERGSPRYRCCDVMPCGHRWHHGMG